MNTSKLKPAELAELTIPDVSSKYGAPMGRGNDDPAELPTGTAITIAQVPLFDGCYDGGGAYWGMPSDLYVAYAESDDDVLTHFARAGSADKMQQMLNSNYPGCIFELGYLPVIETVFDCPACEATTRELYCKPLTESYCEECGKPVTDILETVDISRESY